MKQLTKTSEPNKVSYYDFLSSDTNLAKFILDQLNTIGYVIISDFIVDVSDMKNCAKRLLEISKLVGEPFPHNTSNSIIWNIKANASSDSDSLVKTFSEHMHDAALHTDSQYSYYPEDYFSLLMLKPAICGGGESLILSLADILRELKEAKGGIAAEKILRKTNFPFIVPNVFKKHKNNKKMEFNFGPILGENEIRFRVDTFEKATLLRPDLCREEQLQAYNIIKKVILNSPSIERFYLKERDMIFINNKTTLHGRTSFRDPDRHLLRIRMNKYESISSPKVAKGVLTKCG